MRVMVAMSGGVDSSVAAALCAAEGHEVVGVTLKLWGGAQDAGCCSVGDVEDARRVAQQLGIAHHVFNFAEAFETSVVRGYVDAHTEGRTPNPCIECNRTVKFDLLLGRARRLGFDALATGHHARVGRRPDGTGWRLQRGADPAKDQSYVLHMLGQDALSALRFPVGHLTKAEVRSRASALGLRTAAKPDSQDTCFITATGGRHAFLGQRSVLHEGRLVDAASGRTVGTVPAVELVTIGQRRGLGIGGGPRRYALGIDVPGRTVWVGGPEQLLAERVDVDAWSWTDAPVPPGRAVLAQTTAHGPARPASVDEAGLRWESPQRRVAPGQSVVLYDAATGDEVLGGGVAA